MKRFLCFLFAIMLVISFVACSDDTGNGGENNDGGIIELNPDLNIGDDGEINFPIIPVPD